nr:MAG TPA: hypothetical protein [Caudoviricetes sp.]
MKVSFGKFDIFGVLRYNIIINVERSRIKWVMMLIQFK